MNDRYLLDSNILIYLSHGGSPHRPVTLSSLSKLHATASNLVVCPQSIVEMRAVLTRPATSPNGVGMTAADATAEIATHLKMFAMIPDTLAVFVTWRMLTDSTGTLGKQNHDARMLSAAIAGGCTHLLTFNDADFQRYLPFTSVKIVNPSQL